MSVFVSKLASVIDEMLDYREALGYSRKTHEARLRSIDLFCKNNFPESECLTQEMVFDWLNEQLSGIKEKAKTIRLLGKYFLAIGKDAYVLNDKYYHGKTRFSAYVFTDDELHELFHAVDTIKATKSEPFLPEMAPVLYRLIYVCGLRPNEGREMKRVNINFKSGEILITNTKRKKERVVVMSGDMLRLCREYDVHRSVFSKDNEYFFPSWNGGSLASRQLAYFFGECWRRANPKIDRSDLPGIRVYDLRHRFASAVLNRWLENGQELGTKLPYLRAYMGHDSISETAQYIHLLPENLIKSSGIDWKSFDEMIPEVVTWQE